MVVVVATATIAATSCGRGFSILFDDSEIESEDDGNGNGNHADSDRANDDLTFGFVVRRRVGITLLFEVPVSPARRSGSARDKVRIVGIISIRDRRVAGAGFTVHHKRVQRIYGRSIVIVGKGRNSEGTEGSPSIKTSDVTEKAWPDDAVVNHTVSVQAVCAERRVLGHCGGGRRSGAGVSAGVFNQLVILMTVASVDWVVRRVWLGHSGCKGCK